MSYADLGDTIDVWIVDMDGMLLIIAGETRSGAGPIVEGEIQHIVASIRFDWGAAPNPADTQTSARIGMREGVVGLSPFEEPWESKADQRSRTLRSSGPVSVEGWLASRPAIARSCPTPPSRTWTRAGNEGSRSMTLRMFATRWHGSTRSDSKAIELASTLANAF